MVSESVIRLGSFLGIFLLVSLAEHFRPRRPLNAPKGPRWFCNISIIIIDTLVARLVFPLMPVGMAEIAKVQGWGIFNLVVLPHWLSIGVSVLLLDLIIYLQHRSFHRVPLFWRFHRMHHTDLDLDVTSGNRFHPIEILLSLVIKLGAVAVIGVPVAAVVLFEVVLNATSLFNHGNLGIPVGVDNWLRLCLVTPDMHRVHHSVIPRETDSNFGFNLPWWDRLFGTYRDQPREGHDQMIIGLKEFRDARVLSLRYLLILPFRDRNG